MPSQSSRLVYLGSKSDSATAQYDVAGTDGLNYIDTYKTILYLTEIGLVRKVTNIDLSFWS